MTSWPWRGVEDSLLDQGDEIVQRSGAGLPALLQEVELRALDLLAEDEITETPFGRGGVARGGVDAADQRPDARSDDEVDRDLALLEDLQDTDVGQPARGAASEGEPDLEPFEHVNEPLVVAIPGSRASIYGVPSPGATQDPSSKRCDGVTTPPAERAGGAGGTERPADPPAERNQVDVGRVAPPGGYHGRQESVRSSRGRLRGHPSQTPGDPVDVRVDGKRRPPAREEQDAAGGLLPDSLEPEQVGLRLIGRHASEDTEVQPPLVAQNGAQDIPDDAALGGRQATHPDGVHQFHQRGPEDARPCREPSAQLPVRPVAVHIAGVLRQNRQDQLVERREPTARSGPAERFLQQIE